MLGVPAGLPVEAASPAGFALGPSSGSCTGLRPARVRSTLVAGPGLAEMRVAGTMLLAVRACPLAWLSAPVLCTALVVLLQLPLWIPLQLSRSLRLGAQ